MIDNEWPLDTIKRCIKVYLNLERPGMEVYFEKLAVIFKKLNGAYDCDISHVLSPILTAITRENADPGVYGQVLRFYENGILEGIPLPDLPKLDFSVCIPPEDSDTD